MSTTGIVYSTNLAPATEDRPTRDQEWTCGCRPGLCARRNLGMAFVPGQYHCARINRMPGAVGCDASLLQHTRAVEIELRDGGLRVIVGVVWTAFEVGDCAGEILPHQRGILLVELGA